MKVSASAPGKIVLLGEYAVLDGAPALVMATNRRAEVSVETGRSSTCTVQAPTIGVNGESFEFAADGSLVWQTLDSRLHKRLGLVGQILTSLIKGGILNLAKLIPFKATLQTLEFFQPGRDGNRDKLGLGSSAALTVALASALAEYAGYRQGTEDRKSWLQRLLNAHREFQNGLGSGLDVAASLYGGVIEYQMIGTGPSVKPVSLPANLEHVAIWTGRQASTRTYLEHLSRWQKRAPEIFARLMRRLSRISQAGIRAAKADDAQGFLNAVENYGDAMQELGEQGNMDIYSKEHKHLDSLARSSGAVYKPCGAGGGDVGLAFCADGDGVDELKRSVEKNGYQTIPLEVDPVGLRTTLVTE